MFSPHCLTAIKLKPFVSVILQSPQPDLSLTNHLILLTWTSTDTVLPASGWSGLVVGSNISELSPAQVGRCQPGRGFTGQLARPADWSPTDIQIQYTPPALLFLITTDPLYRVLSISTLTLQPTRI